MSQRHIRAVDRADAKAKRYIGDGVYAVFDGFGIWLTAEDGLRATDAIYLEPNVYLELKKFVRDANEGRRREDDE